MPAVVLYFQVHQPFRLRRYSVFDSDPFYFDQQKNGDICRKVADKCYRPATALLLELIRRHGGDFRVAFSLTGTVLDQFQQHTPDLIDAFARLCDTGCVELLAETTHHSLAFLYSREEFAAQVNAHSARMAALFGQTPRVFRNTELIYNNDLAHYIATMTTPDGKPRFAGVLCEGTDWHLGRRSPGVVYRPPHTGAGPGGRPFALLLKNHRLSDDIAFRFGDRNSPSYPLTAESFARARSAPPADAQSAPAAPPAPPAPSAPPAPPAQVCNLFMDFETFGEHQWADTGIFTFLEQLPAAVLAAGSGNSFLTPSQALERFAPADTYDVPHMISWADSERDLSAWLGNAMQSNALNEVYRLERLVKQRVARLRVAAVAPEAVGAGSDSGSGQARDADALLEDWRKLTTSDHFYYMSTKYWADGDVHTYFSPYDSPYDAYINFMNVLDNLRTRASA
ncbi:MAG: glycoside hydrolase family 57 protein [bacterium]